jgi:hypothetical protein
MPWDTEEDYDIINTMKVFMGENMGRKLFFDTFVHRKYAMQSQHSIFDDFKEFIFHEADTWKRKKSLLLVITYENHYTGIRVDLDGKVTLFDPNYNNSLYTPITPEMRQIIQNAFGSVPVDYMETCQITHDEADSFCQTWSMYLLTHPEFKPSESIRERFSIILLIYRRLLKSKKGKDIYKQFLRYYGYSPLKKYLSINKMSLDRFIKAMYVSKGEYDNRGFNLKF